jgi:GNAT superfamily N-acetyltransferase
VGKQIYIHKLIIPENKRHKGIGTDILKMIIRHGQKINYTITVLPELGYGADNLERLINFYKHAGFIENTILKDDRFRLEYMVKLP